MRVLFFIDGVSSDNGANEVDLEMAYFPVVGDTIVLGDDGYVVTRRYVMVSNLNPTEMQSTWVQYTAHLKSDKG